MKIILRSFLLFFTILLLQITLYSQNDIYYLRYQTINDPNANPPTYNAPTEFETQHISSDYGRRHCEGCTSQWHRGVDYNNSHVVGDRILSINDAIVEKINGDYGYKYIITSGEHHFGFGHLFTDETPPQSGLVCGDMVLKKMVGSDKYAILNLTSMTAIGCIDGIENPMVEYNGQNIEVTDVVDADQPIGIIGNSGTPPTNVHLHLYMFSDVCLAIQGTNHNNITNDRDPLQFISHPTIDYKISIEGKELKINNSHYIDANNVIIFPGDDEISLMVHWVMKNAILDGTRFTNVVMDVDDVGLYIKNSYLPVEGHQNWGTPNSNYQLITGQLVKSFLSHGARLTSEIQPITSSTTYGYPSNPPGNDIINIANDIFGHDGSTTRTGIDPYAHRDGNNQPYDDYYFSDFYTRVHKDYELGGDFSFADINELSKYPDGRYHLYAKAITVRGDAYTSIDDGEDPTEIIIDNFCPFIQEVKITQQWPGIYLPMTIYEFEWLWQPGPTGSLEANVIVNRQAKPNLPINIKITSSEPLEHCNLAINTLGYQHNQNTPLNDERTQWKFEITDFGYCQLGQHTLSIEGHDLAGNQLQDDATVISIRQQMDKNRSTWEPPACPGADEYHSFEISSFMLAFDFTPDQLVAGEETVVNISNTSSGYDGDNYQWYWSFGNAATDPQSYEGKNPPPITYYDYNIPGSYTIQVQIGDGVNLIDFLQKDIEIIDPETYLVVDFNAEPLVDNGELYGNSPFTIQFTDASTGNPDDWVWDFGDVWGESYEQNPSYTFYNNSSSPQQFTVSLQACNTVTNCDVEMKEALITVYPQNAPLDPVANFSFSQTSLFTPCTVYFTNNSSGEIDTFEWDLNGDGIYECNEENPDPIEFVNATNISFSLKVTNINTQASDVFSKQFYVYENPNSGYTVDFSWDPDPGIQGSLIHFDEDVTGFYYSYNCKWIFEGPNGSIWESYLNNPSITFNDQGVYTVLLEIRDFYDILLGVCSKQVVVTPPSLVAAPGEILPDDISYRAFFGNSVAIEGNFAVVGAFGHDYNASLGGAIYIYEYHPENQEWTKNHGPLVPNDIEQWDYFGYSVGISGNYIVVGAPLQYYSVERKGAVYVYKYDGTSWSLQPGKLIPSDATFNDGCGTSLAIDGNYLVIGTSGGVIFPCTDSLNYTGNKDHCGKAYIYKLVNNTWEEICKIWDENGFVDDGFGKCVSISGTRVAVGSDHDKAFVFDRISDDTWAQQTISLGDENENITVSVSHNSLLIGDNEEHYGPAVCNGGRAYIYEFINGLWIKKCDLPHNAIEDLHFGHSVSINGKYAVVGTPEDDIFANRSGSAFIYRKSAYGFWNLVEKVTPYYDPGVEYQNTDFGYSVFCGGSSIIIGRPGCIIMPCNPPPPENFPGAVTIFTNYIYPCDRIITEDDYHPSPGTYPENAAGYITLGGNPPGEVYFQAGVDIAYVGGEILLLDGFTAASGCSFQANAMYCSYIPDKTQSNYTTPYYKENDLVIAKDIISNTGNINTEESGIRIFPNPTNNKLNIVFSPSFPMPVDIEILNIYGHLVLKKEDLTGNQFLLDLSIYPKGVYFIKIAQRNMKYIDKIVLQ